jgi:hypothetical protein
MLMEVKLFYKLLKSTNCLETQKQVKNFDLDKFYPTLFLQEIENLVKILVLKYL